MENPTRQNLPAGSDISPESDFDFRVRCLSALGSLVVGSLFTTLVCPSAFAIALGAAISWDFSGSDLLYALQEGAFWGATGGILIGLITAAIRPETHEALRIVGVMSITWAVISGVCFFVVVMAEATAAC